MGLSIVNDLDYEKESNILNQMYEYIDSNESFVFDSGAGSGKTYALIKCLEHIHEKQYDTLRVHNQKICCITYTNVAANNIINRLGASDVIDISTIHKRLWDIISSQKSALLELHVEKLKSEIKQIENELDEDDDFLNYRGFDNSLKDEFLKKMLANKDIYYKAYTYKASSFRAEIKNVIGNNFEALLKNVANFKKLVDRLYKKERYINCLNKIEEKHKDYCEVHYEQMYNSDRLDKMRISHDTLLEYGYKLVEKYPKMRQIIIDKYPYILIDEYQDTNEYVVKIMALLHKTSKEFGRNILIAYFGDSVQNIYDEGVGDKLSQIHTDLKFVIKEYNRRSHIEIIGIANKIRNDNIVQKSIFSDSNGGDFKFYYGSEQNVSDFIGECETKFCSNTGDILHCLFLKNETIAKYNGFPKLYDSFKNTKLYKINHDQLSTELMNNDITNLGNIQEKLYKLIKLYSDIRDGEHMLSDILPSNKFREMSLSELRELLELIKSVDGNTLIDLLKSAIDIYKNSKHKIFNNIIEDVFDIGSLSMEKIIVNFMNVLYPNADDEFDPNEVLKGLFEISVNELLKWYQYINREETDSICYHTFHNTKGLEFDNVIIVLNENFGINKNLFKDFFLKWNKADSNDETFKKGRNILYVAITRAIKNLRIYYTGNVEEIKNNLESIFGNIQKYSVNTLCND